MLLVGGWLRWPVDCSSSRLTALLGRLLGVLLFIEARSMGRAIQWSPMKPESWSGWFPLKSSPTCCYRWLHCDLQNVPREHANCTAGTVRANRSEASSLLAGWTQSQSQSRFSTNSQSASASWCPAQSSAELSRLLNCLEADPSENTARNNTCCVCWLPWKFCLSGCYLDTDLRKRYLVTGIPNMWEVSMGGSHKCILKYNFNCIQVSKGNWPKQGTVSWSCAVQSPVVRDRVVLVCRDILLVRGRISNPITASWNLLWLYGKHIGSDDQLILFTTFRTLNARVQSLHRWQLSPPTLAAGRR
jgi:hypothetical protein